MAPLTLTDLDSSLRLRLHLTSLFAVAFLSFYARVVCPFIDKLGLMQVMAGLGAVFVFQAFFKSWLFHQFPAPRNGGAPARHGYLLTVIGWLVAGVAATFLHAWLYVDFPKESHLKLLTGYWALGGGILAQFDYLTMETFYRERQGEGPGRLMERITRRLMEGFAIYTMVPGLVMVLMAFRFVFEGYAILGVALEVTFLAMVFAVAALVTAFRYGRALREDCDRILCALDGISQGRFDVAVDAGRPDELGRVADGINKMAEGLALRERIREAFGRFVNPEVAEGFIRDFAQDGSHVKLGGERREVAVLMADLRNFTPLAEKLEPEAVTELLNGYFGEMVASIQENGGMVDKFIGDAVMAVFGLSGGDDDPAVMAVGAALGMREGLVRFNANQERNGAPVLVNGIGVHVGPVVAGYMGSPERLEFTVMGHTVNLAARIESLARTPNPSLLVSGEVVARLGDDVVVEAVGDEALKGVSGLTKVYTVRRADA